MKSPERNRLVRAAERAHQHFAWSTAAERYDAAIALLEPDPGRSCERAWLLFRAGCLLYYGIDAPRGIAYFEQAQTLALAHADPVLAAYARFDCGSARATLMEVRQGLDDMRQADLGGIDLDRAEDALITRPHEDVHVSALPDGGTRWLDDLRAGMPLGDALTRCRDEAQLRSLLTLTLHKQLTIALHPQPEPTA